MPFASSKKVHHKEESTEQGLIAPRNDETEGLEEDTSFGGTIAAASPPSHYQLLLTDSALPLGSFAFSSGLESYLAHHSPTHNGKQSTLYHFMHLSILSLASTTLPYLTAVFRSPDRLQALDDELDACLLCPVARRASISQGRAMLTLWERSFAGQVDGSIAKTVLQGFSAAFKMPLTDGAHDEQPACHAHFPVVFSVVGLALGLSLRETAYTYLLNHVKTVASAAVRASVLGPYAAQGLLASKWVRAEIERAIDRDWDSGVEQAGQTIPPLDVWIGRHELLYSRIFNS